MNLVCVVICPPFAPEVGIFSLEGIALQPDPGYVPPEPEPEEDEAEEAEDLEFRGNVLLSIACSNFH